MDANGGVGEAFGKVNTCWGVFKLKRKGLGYFKKKPKGLLWPIFGIIRGFQELNHTYLQ